RGACVTLLGLVLELAPTSVMVVLVPFGLSMMLTAPLLLVPSRVLVPLLGVLALGGAPLAAAVPGPVEFGTVTLLSLDDPVGVLRGLVLTGQYPLITWVPYLLLGIVLMRGLLRAQQHGDPVRSSRHVLLAGAVTAAAAHRRGHRGGRARAGAARRGPRPRHSRGLVHGCAPHGHARRHAGHRRPLRRGARRPHLGPARRPAAAEQHRPHAARRRRRAAEHLRRSRAPHHRRAAPRRRGLGRGAHLHALVRRRRRGAGRARRAHARARRRARRTRRPRPARGPGGADR